VSSIAEKLQFIAVKAVAAVGENVEKGKGGGDRDQDSPVTGSGCPGVHYFLFGCKRSHAGCALPGKILRRSEDFSSEEREGARESELLKSIAKR
jgi:hypothetical protein